MIGLELMWLRQVVGCLPIDTSNDSSANRHSVTLSIRRVAVQRPGRQNIHRDYHD
jgi:hypothetical protein